MQLSLELTRCAPQMPREARLWSVGPPVTNAVGFHGERTQEMALTMRECHLAQLGDILRNRSDAVN
jgi:hypothetical protein